MFPNSKCGPWQSLEKLTIGTDGFTRFTPTEIGSYQFLNGSQLFELTVVDPEDNPFHNLNYLPSQSIVSANDSLWIAQAYAPRVSRISSSGEVLEVPVGSWPVAVGHHESLSHLLVVHKGSDTVGWLNLSEAILEDAIWVGDEPTNIILSPDGKHAYVALGTESAIAVIDTATREVVQRFEAIRDPMALALSGDGQNLFVASQRSGQIERYPFETTHEASEEVDLVVIDTQSGEIIQQWLDVGGTINGLLYDNSRDRIYLTSVDGNPSASLVDTEDPTFFHYVKAFDTNGNLIQSTDLSRQPSSTGPAVTPHGMSIHNEMLWVAIEGTSEILALNAETFEELERISVSGLPRAVYSDGTNLHVHGNQDFKLHTIGSESINIGTDPRPASVKLGQEVFMSAGAGYGENYSCNSCHADGKGDGRIWKAGPFEVWEASKGFFWLEGTGPTGWGGYTSRIENFGFEGTASVNITITTEEATGLSSYLASLMPPPAANGHTERDGLLSDAALRGESIFYGKGECASCHPAPLYTTNQTVFDGLSPDTRASIPSLVGVYRNPQFLKHGQTKSYEEAVEHILSWQNISLDEAEKFDLMQYLNELTAREFFVLRGPEMDTPLGVDQPITVTFTEPLWTGAKNLEKIVILDGTTPIDLKMSVDGRHLVIEPTDMLQPEHDYTLRLAEGLSSWAENQLETSVEYTIKTAERPTLELSGEYEWTVQVPAFTPTGFDLETLLPISVRFEAIPTASGSKVTFYYNEVLSYTRHAVMNGNNLIFPDLPFFVGASAADTTGIDAQFLDLDGDGVADQAIGRVTLTGPGIWLEDLLWEIKPAPPIGVCIPGPSGDVDVSLNISDDAMEIDWGSEGLLGFFVTTPGATIPLGPGQTVQNGETYWALSTSDFPNGFYGPLTYGALPTGAIDISEDNNGVLGGLDIPEGECLTIHAVTDNFEIGTFTYTFESAVQPQ